ncbi:hypothetical protein AGABI2DRAFT_147363 [Agaricus bisporus var. bisporus H97]|uniref:hypothetical protein n=1 Tax=Agaricus bisporus var. bisporus (strain H97 / ATCC MYA-4626 / FGSC 10389) TaxID=936046 RepID=UPI00029F61D7|nr:hypothetical protein AGABI2DRAFT_147363 [Agaricus bisporus var. bisporus H97]EKV51011.1 hypothetical protein AGABI2DRAFT_147363 [Agaricus bisporus var. bisporus H97]
MLMFLLSHLISAWFAFLLPSYATFKALAHPPDNQQELQRWGMYWSVVGVFLAVEYAAEWLISWLPFYWEAKTLFLLFLALPQTQGSTYIYNNYLQPFFVQNESDFDAGIVQVQKNIVTFIQSRLAFFWEWLANIANKGQGVTSTNTTTNGQAPPNSAVQTVLGLWKTYGNSALSVLGYSTSTQSSAGNSNNGVPSPSASSAGAPSFPEPQHVH